MALRTLKEKRRKMELETAEAVADRFCTSELTNHTDLRSGPTPNRKKIRDTHANVMRSTTNAMVIAAARMSMVVGM
jgi:hypothetical protein